MENEKQLPCFVYGTLRNGHGNYNRLLKGVTIAEQAALTTGYMFAVNGGAYPALKRFPKGVNPIKGELMYIKPERYKEVLRSLDWLEGYNRESIETSFYLRVQKKVWNESEGKMVDAWVYYWNGSFKGLRFVESGCWNEYKGGLINGLRV